MGYDDFVKKLLAGFAIVVIFGGGVMALTGLYLKIFNVCMIGCTLVLVGVFVIQMVFRKFGSF